MQAGQIVLFRFPQTDLAEGKLRPAVLLARLPDIFDALPAEEAQQAFQRELAAIRSLCLKLLGEKQLAA